MVKRPRRGRRGGLKLLGALGILGASLGCSSTPGGGELGELGTGTFSHDCVVATDPVCSQANAIDSFVVTESLGSDEELPEAVAVGAHFGLSYEGKVRVEGGQVAVTARPASEKDELSGDVFRIAQPGFASFLAVDAQGRVADFATVEAVEATDLTIWSNQVQVEELSLSEGDEARLTVLPTGAAGSALAGALSFRWERSNDAVELGPLGGPPTGGVVVNQGDVLLQARSPGSARVRVSSGDLQADLLVEVTP